MCIIIRSPHFDAELFLNTFHADRDSRFLSDAKDNLEDKKMSNAKVQRLLLLSSSPLVLENFFKVRDVNARLSSGQSEGMLSNIYKEKESN